jgi:hypothetical protein
MPRQMKFAESEPDCTCKFEPGEAAIRVQYDPENVTGILLPICTKCGKPWKNIEKKGGAKTD